MILGSEAEKKGNLYLRLDDNQETKCKGYHFRHHKTEYLNFTPQLYSFHFMV